MPEYLLAAEVAELYRTTAGALHSQRHRGEAPGSLGVMVGARILWKISDLDAWFADQQAATLAATGRSA